MLRIVVLLTLLSTISAAEPKPLPGTAADRERAWKFRLEAARAYSSDLYAQNMDKNAKWYVAGAKALELRDAHFARVNEYGFQKDIDAMRAAFSKALAEGCNDPLVRNFTPPDLVDERTPAQEIAYPAGLAAASTRNKYPAPRHMLFLWNAAAKYEQHADKKAVGYLRECEVRYNAFWAAFTMAAQLRTPIADSYCMDHVELMIDRADGTEERKERHDRIAKCLADANASDWLKQTAAGYFHLQHAWDARGTKLAGQTTPEQFKVFEERQLKARRAFEKAIELEPNRPQPATQLIAICMGLGYSKKIMEEYFEKAMVANPDNYRACTAKANFLQPKWGGGPGELAEFYSQCAAHPDFTAGIPFLPFLTLSNQTQQSQMVQLSRLFKPNGPAYDWGIPVYERYLKLQRDDPKVVGHLRCLYVMAGDQKSAEALAKRVPASDLAVYLQLTVSSFPEEYARREKEIKDE